MIKRPKPHSMRPHETREGSAPQKVGDPPNDLPTLKTRIRQQKGAHGSPKTITPLSLYCNPMPCFTEGQVARQAQSLKSQNLQHTLSPRPNEKKNSKHLGHLPPPPFPALIRSTKWAAVCPAIGPTTCQLGKFFTTRATTPVSLFPPPLPPKIQSFLERISATHTLPSVEPLLHRGPTRMPFLSLHCCSPPSGHGPPPFLHYVCFGEQSPDNLYATVTCGRYTPYASAIQPCRRSLSRCCR